MNQLLWQKKQKRNDKKVIKNIMVAIKSKFILFLLSLLIITCIGQEGKAIKECCKGKVLCVLPDGMTKFLNQGHDSDFVYFPGCCRPKGEEAFIRECEVLCNTLDVKNCRVMTLTNGSDGVISMCGKEDSIINGCEAR